MYHAEYNRDISIYEQLPYNGDMTNHTVAKGEAALASLYRRSTLAFLVAMVLVFGLAYILPQWMSESVRLRDELTHQSEIRAIYLEAAIDRCVQTVQALGSRTQIRLALKDYAEGRTDLSFLQSYTQSRYEDGAKVYPDLVLAVRVGPSGEKVAVFGESPPEVDLLLEDVPVCSDSLPGLQPVFLPSGEVLILVWMPIMEGGIRIGTDIGLFNVQSQLGVDADQISMAIVPAPGNGDTARHGSFPAPLGDTGLWYTASWAPALEQPSLGEVLPSALGLLAASMVALIVLGRASIFAGTRRILSALNQAVRERDLALREANHRIKNNLVLVSGAISLRSAGPGGQAARELLREIEAQVHSIAAVHELLQGGSLSGIISLGVYIQRVVASVMSAVDPDGRIRYQVSGDDPPVAVSTATRIGLILNELVTNAIKYGRQPEDPEKPQLTVSVSYRTDGGFDLSVSNEGTPVSSEQDPLESSSLGMTLVTAYGSDLGASLRFLCDPHTTFMLSFPASAVTREKQD
jgi:two-component sensor histidine kinase